jgi:hypothetical protein
MKKIYSLFILLILISACKKKPLDSVPEDKPIVISSIMPTSGLPGAEVTVTGSQFGTTISDVNVKINGTTAEVIAVTNESIRVKVKTGTTSGKLVVTVKGKEVQGPDFSISNVLITEIYPKSALAGETVTLTGTNFGTDKTKVSILFGNTPAEITELTNTSIKTKVPINFEEGKIILKVLDSEIESPFTFLNDVSGIVDESFTNSLSNFIWVNCLSTNGQFIFAGGASEGGIAIFDTQGKLIKKFSAANGFTDKGNAAFVNSIEFHPTNPNRVYIGGQFTTFNGKSTPNFISLIYSGGDWILDDNFKLNVPRPAYTSAFQIINSQLKILVGQNNSPLLRLNEDGSVDNSFNQGGIGFSNSSSGGLHIQGIAVEPGDNGKIIVAGTFNSYNGALINTLVRLNSNGSLDYTYPNINFGSGGNPNVSFLKLDEQNNVYIAGREIKNSNSESGIIKINSVTGQSFNLFKAGNQNSWSPEVNYMAKSRTGKYLLLGEIASFSKYGNTPIKGIAMVNKDGTLNSNFGKNGTIDIDAYRFYTALRLPNGKFMVGGYFDKISGKTYNGLAIIK